MKEDPNQRINRILQLKGAKERSSAAFGPTTISLEILVLVSTNILPSNMTADKEVRKISDLKLYIHIY